MSYRILIIDDNKEDSENLCVLTRNWADKNKISVELKTYPSAEAFLFHYEEEQDCALVLLDIEMTGMDGVTLAKKLREKNKTIGIVFVTGYSDYIAEGYDVAALHYLMKPVNEVKFAQVLERAMEHLHREERMLTLKTADETFRVSLSRIFYLEAARNYVMVHGEGFPDCMVRHKLGDFTEELDKRFLRVGRSYIVNLSKLHRISRTEICFSDGNILPLPRGWYDTINRAIIELL